jgi:hypothetical protein
MVFHSLLSQAMKRFYPSHIATAVFALFANGFQVNAQAPIVFNTILSPALNANSANRNAPVIVPFSQPINPATSGNIKLFSSQYLGQRTAAVTTNGAAVTVSPTASANQPAAFKPGETVCVSIPGSVQSVNGAGVVPYVYQFTAAATGGSGNFVFGSNVSIGAVPGDIYPIDVALGDVDGDGDLDMVTANLSQSQTRANGYSVSVRLNDGTGHYSGATEINGASNPYEIVLGDIDADGDLDILTANNGVPDPFNQAAQHTVSVLRNDGSGRFSIGPSVTIGANVMCVALGDMDGDGDLDIVALNYYSYLTVRLNNGNGVFAAGTQLSTYGSFSSMDLGDFDGDGDLDVVMGGYTTTRPAATYANNGSGVLTARSSIVVGYNTRAVRFGDIDGDGDLDLITANSGDINSSGYVQSSLSVRLNDGTGTFSGTTDLPMSFPPRSVVLSDVDGDGDLDLVACGNPVPITVGAVGVFINDGVGGFTQAQNFAASGLTLSSTAGDVDSDGDIDLVTANGNYSASVFLNQGSTVTAVTASRTAALNLYPNPAGAADKVFVDLPVAASVQEARLYLVNALGQTVATSALPVRQGRASGFLPAVGLVAGVYTVRLQAGAASVSRRLVLL